MILSSIHAPLKAFWHPFLKTKHQVLEPAVSVEIQDTVPSEIHDTVRSGYWDNLPQELIAGERVAKIRADPMVKLFPKHISYDVVVESGSEAIAKGIYISEMLYNQEMDFGAKFFEVV